VSELETQAESFRDAITDLNKYWEGQGDKIGKSKKSIKDSGTALFDNAVNGLVAVIVLVAILGTFASFLSWNKSKPSRAICCLNLTSALIVLVLLVLSIIVCVGMIVSIPLGNFCSADVDTTMTDMFEEGGAAEIADSRSREMLTDFIMCSTGTSAMSKPIKAAITGTNELIDAVKDLQSTLDLTRGLCSLDPRVDAALDKILATASQSATSVIIVGEEACCVKITPLWRKTFHDGLCTHLLEGIYKVWSLGAAVWCAPLRESILHLLV
jgi:hypothetical protein